MKPLILILCILSFSSFADENCELYELSGSIRENKDHDLEIVLSAKTMSEKILPFHFKARPKAAPYQDLFISGDFILQNEQIIGVQKIDTSVPDPLNQNESTVKKKLKDVPCPEL